VSCSIFKFLRNPRKPVILAMSRPDAKKNITTLVKAFGNNKVLREIANLVLVMGNREVSEGKQHCAVTWLLYTVVGCCAGLAWDSWDYPTLQLTGPELLYRGGVSSMVVRPCASI
jgi:hypothetical protein